MKLKIILFGIAWWVFLASPTQAVEEIFYKKDNQIYDSWRICRTRSQGVDGFFQVTEKGFRPIITFESLGKNAELAYKYGKEFLAKYPDSYQRAEEIFRFARNRVRYTSDLDQFGHREFALNADELVARIEKGNARGDCEDFAILLATMYKAAGYRSAIVLVPGHAAALVYLPGYRKANAALKFNGQSDWIWAEATGRSNHLGWAPSRALQGKAIAYEIKAVEDLTQQSIPENEIVQVKRKTTPLAISPFFSILFLMWILPLLSRVFMVMIIRRKD
jgi:hypothetical protein